MHRQFLLLLCLMAAVLGACSAERGTRTVTMLRVMVLPDQSEEVLRARYAPLMQRITEVLGVDVELQIPDSYSGLVDAFAEGKADLAYFGGVTYVKAHERSDAVPLAMRDIDLVFQSVAMVRRDSRAKSLTDVRGGSIAFGSEHSTSGHFMPRFFLTTRNIEPETFFESVQYAGTHDRTVDWVRRGEVDVGIVNRVIVRQMFDDGRLNPEEVRVIWTSPPYANYVWALQPDIAREQRTLIQDVFLGLNQASGGDNILRALGAGYFLPASHLDFLDLAQAVHQIQSAGRAR